MVKKPPLLAKLYLGSFQKAKLLVVQGNPKAFILDGEWEVQSVTDEGVMIGLWFYTTKCKADPDSISPEDKRNCYRIYNTGQVEAETVVPEEEVKELHYLWSLGIQEGVNRALSYLHKRGLVPAPVLLKRSGKVKEARRVNLRGDPIF